MNSCRMWCIVCKKMAVGAHFPNRGMTNDFRLRKLHVDVEVKE